MGMLKNQAIVLTLAATAAFFMPPAADARSMPAGSDQVVVRDIKVIAQDFYANNSHLTEATIKGSLSQYNSGQLNEIRNLYSAFVREDLKMAPKVGTSLVRSNQNASISQIKSRAVQDIYRKLASDIQQKKGNSYDLGRTADREAGALLKADRDVAASVISKMAADAAQREVVQKYGTPENPKTRGFLGFGS
jgi:hypothetical protein